MKVHPFRHNPLSRKLPFGRRPILFTQNRALVSPSHDASVNLPVVWKNLLSGQTHSGDRVHVGGVPEQKGSRVKGDAYVCASDSVEEGSGSQVTKKSDHFRAWMKRQRKIRRWSRKDLVNRLAEIGFEITENKLWRIESGQAKNIDIEFYVAVQVAFDEAFPRELTDQDGLEWLRSFLMTQDPLGRISEIPDEVINLMKVLIILRDSD